MLHEDAEIISLPPENPISRDFLNTVPEASNSIENHYLELASPSLIQIRILQK